MYIIILIYIIIHIFDFVNRCLQSNVLYTDIFCRNSHFSSLRQPICNIFVGYLRGFRNFFVKFAAKFLFSEGNRLVNVAFFLFRAKGAVGFAADKNGRRGNARNPILCFCVRLFAVFVRLFTV